MGFLKKVLVIKQVENGYSAGNKPISGIVRIESENGVTEFFLSVINAAAAESGEYRAFVADGKRDIYCFPLGKRPSSAAKVFTGSPDFEKGFAAGLCYISDDLPVTVAFARSDGMDYSVTDFKKAVAEKCLAERRAATKKEEKTSTVSTPLNPPIAEKSQYVLQKYDDEAVATENYYEIDEKIKDKIQLIKEKENGGIRSENDVSRARSEEEAEKSFEDACGVEDEADARYGKEYNEKSPYFLTVGSELNEIFEKFPKEEGLTRLFAGSRWAKITYSENKFYVVGVIKENKKEKYICYGVPARYAPEPPEPLKGCCSFIPLSVFDMQGDGFWMMFQDAVTGKCIKMKKQ